jgi:hypothetical protein
MEDVMVRKLFVVVALLVAFPLVANAGSRTYKPMKVDTTKYSSVQVARMPGCDTYAYSTLVPKCGSGSCLVQRSGGIAGLTSYSKFNLQGRKYSNKTVDSTKYKATTLLKIPGADTYTFSVLVPKSGSGAVLLQRSGGFIGRTLYSTLGL